MNEECASLLKSVCALKGVSVSEHVYQCVFENFSKLVYEDNQVQQMFLAGDYREGGPASILKQNLIEDLPTP